MQLYLNTIPPGREAVNERLVCLFMGTVGSWSEPEIEHLVKRHGQPRGHRCKQYTCVTLTSFKGWQPRDCFLLEFSSELVSSDQGKLFLSYFWLVTSVFDYPETGQRLMRSFYIILICIIILYIIYIIYYIIIISIIIIYIQFVCIPTGFLFPKL